MTSKAHITPDVASSVIKGEMFAGATLLAFRDPSFFRAAELHRHTDLWVELFRYSTNNFSDVQVWNHNLDSFEQFFTLYKGSYKGFNQKNYNFLDCDWFKKLLFPLIHLPSCYRTVCWTACYRTVQ